MNASNEFKKDKRLVLLGYIGATAFCLLCGITALYVAECVNHHLFISHTWLQVLRLLGIIPGAIGVYGTKGWEIQTLSGNTPPEILNQRLSKALIAIGFIATIFTLGLTED